MQSTFWATCGRVKRAAENVEWFGTTDILDLWRENETKIPENHTGCHKSPNRRIIEALTEVDFTWS